MDNRSLLERITALVAEEQQLQETPGHDKKKLRELEIALDQCYDLLRQRRARREFGDDPDGAAPRDPEVVERYLQ